MLKRNVVHCVGLLAASVLAMAPLHAEEFSVGRAEVQLPGGPWRELALQDAGQAYAGEVSGTISSETKVFVKEGAGQAVEALVLVRSSSGGIRGGTMTYSGGCDGDEVSYAEVGQLRGQGSTQCLRVIRSFETQSVLKALAPQLPAQWSSAAVLPKSVITVMSHSAVGTGTFLDVRVFLAPGFAGSIEPVDAVLPEGVKAPHVAWARLLSEAVRASVFSLSGKLVFPPFEFKSGDAVASGRGQRSANGVFLVSEIPASRILP